MTTSYKQLKLDDLSTLESGATEVSSVALGGKILSCSDEWFAPASDLLLVEPAPSLKGQFGPKGALFSGWETRRHNPEPTDWVILRLGPAGGANVVGFDVDTAHFNGNEAPEVEVFGLSLDPSEDKSGAVLRHTDPRWAELLPRVPCGPSQRHLFSIPPSGIITHIKLHMIPDGGIARFRVYGKIPAPPTGLGVAEVPHTSDTRLNTLDLAHSMNGGQVVFTSDQHFGKGPNILLPGRGHDMGDGWETKRSRAPGHKDWLVIKLGEPGFLNYAEIDTAHFLGNFPDSVELHGIDFDGELPPGTEQEDGASTAGWTQLLTPQKTGPGKQHFYNLSNIEGKRFSHIRVTMHPDGGIKRVRIIGRRAAPLANYNEPLPAVALPGLLDKALPLEPATVLSSISNAASAAFSAVSAAAANASNTTRTSSLSSESNAAIARAAVGPNVPLIQATPLTSDSFRLYGQLIAGPNPGLANKSLPHIMANQGTAHKYPHQSNILQSFPLEAQATTNMHLYRCDSLPLNTLPLQLKMLERHRFSSQSFIPMHSPPHKGDYLVLVALNHSETDEPDLSTLAAFLATGSQGICYHPGVWHLPMTPVSKEEGQWLDYACIVAESPNQPELNCDEKWWQETQAAIYL